VKPEKAMRLALAQARKASGRTTPNPPVGAIVFKGENVLGRGYTRPAGEDHAEIVALARCRKALGEDSPRGASVAVTLEPCSHTGRTGPCCEVLIQAGVAKVIIGHLDPNPEVEGQGIARLREAGIEVEVGVLEDECRAQHRGFLSVLKRGRPFVSLKLATSLDGRIATVSGDSRWITGPESRAHVHKMRNNCDAILVGSGTALADDPALTARKGKRVVHRPLRLLLDSKLTAPPSLKMISDEGECWVLCGEDASTQAERALLDGGARVLRLPLAADHRVELEAALKILAQEGLSEIFVEGGGKLAAALLRQGLIDEVSWFVAPVLLGGDGWPALGSLGIETMSEALGLELSTLRRFGPDLCLQGIVKARKG
jgi:diaminohydroxyphosphoribosylaminopyrimidine deaminase/5-amino-6-(5-phosphoribosylamino)uracil reductase